MVGGVGGMMKDKGKERWKKKEVGLGWIEFMEEGEVWEGVIDRVEEWGKEGGMGCEGVWW